MLLALLLGGGAGHSHHRRGIFAAGGLDGLARSGSGIDALVVQEEVFARREVFHGHSLWEVCVCVGVCVGVCVYVCVPPRRTASWW